MSRDRQSNNFNSSMCQRLAQREADIFCESRRSRTMVQDRKGETPLEAGPLEV